MTEELSEKLTLDTPLSATDAVAQLSDLTGKDDEGVLQKIPKLRDLQEEVRFQEVFAGGGDRQRYGKRFNIIGANVTVTIKHDGTMHILKHDSAEDHKKSAEDHKKSLGI